MKFSHFELDETNAHTKGISQLVAIFHEDKDKVFDENGSMRKDVVHTLAIPIDLPRYDARTIWKHIKFFKDCFKALEEINENQKDD
jgi:hypothetical protein